MSDPSEDYSTVLVSSVSTLPPGLVLIVAVVSIVGLVLLFLVACYYFSGRGGKVSNMTQMKEEEGVEEEEMEVIREDGAYHNYSRSHCVDSPDLLVVPKVNKGRSPNIFEVSDDDFTKDTVGVTIETENCDCDQENDQIGDLNFEDIICPPSIGSEKLDDKEVEKEGLQSVKENTMYVSSLSLNLFSDCLEMSAEDCLSLIPGTNSPTLSFRSAITTVHFNSYLNASYINTSFESAWSLGSSATNTPVCKMKFGCDSSNMSAAASGQKRSFV